MKILRIVYRPVIVLALFLIAGRLFQHPGDSYYGVSAPEEYVFGSPGNAPDDIRAEVIAQLREFQRGYTARDTSRIREFMADLFSDQNVLVLGTMPREVLTDARGAQRLVWSDWLFWGDVRFIIDEAQISSAGDDVAWIATKGYVRFDLSRFLILPLRLTAVMVREDGALKFQQQQFQFDLDLTPLLLLQAILGLWLVVEFIVLAFYLIRALMQRRRARTPLAA
jgi:hypothetical protein